MRRSIFAALALSLVALMVPSSALAAVTSVTVGGQTRTVNGVNIARATNALVIYTPTYGASTRTNVYGFEAAVVNGKVTQVADSVGNLAIPSNGYVLSGHGTSKTWLKANAKVGATVTQEGEEPPPPTPGPNEVSVKGQVKALTGTDVARGTNALIKYTPAKGARTGTNVYGFEAAVVNGKVTAIEDLKGNMAIPANGFVLSGHGTSRTWLKTYATVGATVVFGGSAPPTGPGDPPAPVSETRVIDGTVTCQTLTVAVLNQKRTNTWKWDDATQTWVPAWSAWSTTSTGTRAATKADCVNNIVSTPASDALLPDIRIKNLNKCGTGDSNATNGKCFLIQNPAPANPDFPDLEGKKLLKFPVITLNVGGGPAEVIADRTGSDPSKWTAYQTLYRPNGERQNVLSPAVDFYYAGDGHNHWHFRDFDYYWIEKLDGTDLRDAEKHGYCLEDNTTWSGLSGQPGVPTNPVYQNGTSCGKGLPNALIIIEGLSKGWGDTYPLSLPDQAIDITGLPDGRYRVGITADNIGAVKESNENNNTATMEISISGNTVTTYPETATGGLN